MNIPLISNSQNPAIISNGLLGYWSFHDQSGTTARDFSGNQNDGTLVNCSWRVPGLVGGSSISIDGGYVTAPTSPSLVLPNGSSVTMCAWVYNTTNSVGYYGILAKRTLANYEYGINFHYGFDVIQVYTSGPSDVVAFTYTFPTNVWTHVVGVIQSVGTTLLYINGVLYGSAGTGGGVVSGTNPLYLGNSNSEAISEPLSGLLGNVRIYNRALSANEVQMLYSTKL